jgi:hypothetical protein
MGYATLDDLADWYDEEDLPANAARLLARASERIDELIIGVIYDVDDDEMPTDPAAADALKRATCAQVQYMAVGGDETGALAGYTSVSVGGVSYSRNVSAGGAALSAMPRHAPDAVGILQAAGLLTVTASTG